VSAHDSPATAYDASCAALGDAAGPDCSGQVLVIYDALGIRPGRPARLVRNFLAEGRDVAAALAADVAAIRDGSFPGAGRCF